MSYCIRCESERPQGTVYCRECGSRLQGTQRPLDETPESGQKMGEATAAHFTPAGSCEAQAAVVRPARRLADVWYALGAGGKLAGLGAILAIIGFFVPTTRILSPGLVITRSLFSVGGVFLIIPVLSLLALFLAYWQTQEPSLRNRLLIYAALIGLGCLILPVALTVWLSGLVGGLLIFLGFLLVIVGGYVLMVDSTHGLV